MKIDTLRVRAQGTCRLPIDGVDALSWVGEAIEDICSKHPEAGKRTEEEISISVVPSDYIIKKSLLKLIEITNQDGRRVENVPCNFVLNDDNTVTFFKSGSFKIKYLSLPDIPGNVNSEIPLPHFYVPCITFYLAYKIRGGLFGQGDANAVSFYQLYEAKRDNGDIARQRQPMKRRMPPGRG